MSDEHAAQIFSLLEGHTVEDRGHFNEIKSRLKKLEHRMARSVVIGIMLGEFLWRSADAMGFGDLLARIAL